MGHYINNIPDYKFTECEQEDIKNRIPEARIALDQYIVKKLVDELRNWIKKIQEHNEANQTVVGIVCAECAEDDMREVFIDTLESEMIDEIANVDDAEVIKCVYDRINGVISEWYKWIGIYSEQVYNIDYDLDELRYWQPEPLLIGLQIARGRWENVCEDPYHIIWSDYIELGVL